MFGGGAGIETGSKRVPVGLSRLSKPFTPMEVFGISPTLGEMRAIFGILYPIRYKTTRASLVIYS